MEEKVLEMLEPDVLNKSFNNHGREVPFKNYLIKEVFPYMDLTNETIKLKSGFVVSLKDFFEQSILYTCQNKYEGDFVSFAKDNIISFEEGKKRVEKKRFSNVTGNLSPTAKIYPFFEYLDGPQYQVIVDKDKHQKRWEQMLAKGTALEKIRAKQMMEIVAEGEIKNFVPELAQLVIVEITVLGKKEFEFMLNDGCKTRMIL